jgi:hypothetical protein
MLRPPTPRRSDSQFPNLLRSARILIICARRERRDLRCPSLRTAPKVVHIWNWFTRFIKCMLQLNLCSSSWRKRTLETQHPFCLVRHYQTAKCDHARAFNDDKTSRRWIAQTRKRRWDNERGFACVIMKHHLCLEVMRVCDKKAFCVKVIPWKFHKSTSKFPYLSCRDGHFYHPKQQFFDNF